jgi:hypothetical protein
MNKKNSTTEYREPEQLAKILSRYYTKNFEYRNESCNQILRMVTE